MKWFGRKQKGGEEVEATAETSAHEQQRSGDEAAIASVVFSIDVRLGQNQ
jgi:hypothetical protein